MIDKKLWRNFDYVLIIIILLISVISVFTISSATRVNISGEPFYYAKRQMLWVGIGFFAMLVTLFVDYLNFSRFYKYLYYGNLILLVAVLFIGRESGGAQRWISLGFYELQPSEFAKIIIILTLGKILSDQKEDIETYLDIIPFAFHVLLPMMLIFLQPDLGTSLVFGVIFIVMVYVAGFPGKPLLLGVVGVIVVVTPIAWRVLKDYQKMRLTIFINRDLDPLGYGYHITQSIIAIGSGGPWGKGLYQGSQSRLNFLPEQHTDFIFSVLGEEFGFVGAFIVIALYTYLIYRIIRIGAISKDLYGTLICTGVAAMFLFQVLVNIGMTVSLMPVTGLPLPFMSYGGSSYLANMIAIGLVLNVGMRRYKILF